MALNLNHSASLPVVVPGPSRTSFARQFGERSGCVVEECELGLGLGLLADQDDGGMQQVARLSARGTLKCHAESAHLPVRDGFELRSRMLIACLSGLVNG